MKHRHWEEKERLFLKKYYPIYGADYCSEKLNIKRNIIVGEVHRNKIVLNKETFSEIRYNVSDKNKKSKLIVPIYSFYKIKKPEIAYFLGFLWADGHVTKKHNGINIEINSEDYNSIENVLNKIIKWNKYTRIRKMDNGNNSKELTSINLSDFQLHDFLVNNDYLIKSGASPDKILSKIPKDLQHYWWRGYFDGDGHIGLQNLGCTVSIASTYNQDWGFIKSIPYNINYKIIKRIDNKKKHKHSIFILYNLKNSFIFLDWLYKNYNNDKIGLKRKFNSFIDVKNRLTVRFYRKLLGIKITKYKKYYAFFKENKRRTWVGSFDNIYSAILNKYNKMKQMETECFKLQLLLGITTKEVMNKILDYCKSNP